MNRTANKYLRAVKRAIPFRNMRTRVMETLRPACESFAAECPDAGRAAYDAHFGTPEQIACGALESTSSSAVLHTVRRNRRIWLIALIAAALVLIGLSIPLLRLWKVASLNLEYCYFEEDLFIVRYDDDGNIIDMEKIDKGRHP